MPLLISWPNLRSLSTAKSHSGATQLFLGIYTFLLVPLFTPSNGGPSLPGGRPSDPPHKPWQFRRAFSPVTPPLCFAFLPHWRFSTFKPGFCSFFFVSLPPFSPPTRKSLFFYRVINVEVLKRPPITKSLNSPQSRRTSPVFPPDLSDTRHFVDPFAAPPPFAFILHRTSRSLSPAPGIPG